MPEDKAQAILHELRRSPNPLSVLRRWENGQILHRPSVQAAALSALPQVHSETELKLMVQHPAAYPALNLSLDAILSKNTLLESAKILAFDLPQGSPVAGAMDRSRVSGQPVSRTARLQEACDKSNPADKPDAQPDKDLQCTVEDEVFESSMSKYTEPLLACIHIEYWTGVSVTNDYAARAISLYLEADHQILRIFDTQLFLNDLIHLRHDYCSAFLVNSLLAFASQGYSMEDATANAKSFDFEKEAKMLRHSEQDDSVPTMAGLMLLFMSLGSHGLSGADGLTYLFEASEMAKRMKLFGVEDTLTAAQISSLTEEAQRAFVQTAWGVFNMHK